MGVKGRPSISKRQKEQARKEQREKKEQRREERKQERGKREPNAPGVDPDIAHITPGPQPLPED